MTSNFVRFCPDFDRGHVGFALSVAQDCLHSKMHFLCGEMVCMRVMRGPYLSSLSAYIGYIRFPLGNPLLGFY